MKSGMPSDEGGAPIRRLNDLLHVRGEKPTRAGPIPRAEAAGGSAVGNRPWGRTRVAPRGAVMEWSARGEPVRLRMVAWQRGAPVQTPRVAWDVGASSCVSFVGCRRIGPRVPARADRDRGARRHSTTTTGTLTPSPSSCFGGVTGRYKRPRNPVRRRWHRWPDLCLRRTQHLPVKARPMASRVWSARAEASR